MSVVRGRPPGLAGGINGASSAYCSSLRACPAPKSPTSARLSAVHMACLREGLLPSRTADATAPPHARPDGASFSNGLSERWKGSLMRTKIVEKRLNSLPDLSRQGKRINGLHRLLA